MKKILIAGTILSLVCMSFLPGIPADDNDTFDITASGEYLWMEIGETAWALSVVEMSSVHYTNATDTFNVYINDTTVNVDLTLQITTDGATWNAATAGNGPDADVYRLNASTDTWSAHDVQIITASGTEIISNWDPGVSESDTFDLRFDAPTSTTTGAEQSITVTATIAKT